MAVNNKDIEALWKQCPEEGVDKGISVAQFFESNGVPYRTFEKNGMYRGWTGQRIIGAGQIRQGYFVV